MHNAMSAFLTMKMYGTAAVDKPMLNVLTVLVTFCSLFWFNIIFTTIATPTPIVAMCISSPLRHKVSTLQQQHTFSILGGFTPDSSPPHWGFCP
jgi:hypothetical protein